MFLNFKIAETENYSKKLSKINNSSVSSKIKSYIYPQLKENPFFGPNIKKLKGKYESVYRYRIGKFRLFYLIDIDKKLVIIIDIEERKDSYKIK